MHIRVWDLAVRVAAAIPRTAPRPQNSCAVPARELQALGGTVVIGACSLPLRAFYALLACVAFVVATFAIVTVVCTKERYSVMAIVARSGRPLRVDVNERRRDDRSIVVKLSNDGK